MHICLCYVLSSKQGLVCTNWCCMFNISFPDEDGSTIEEAQGENQE